MDELFCFCNQISRSSFENYVNIYIFYLTINRYMHVYISVKSRLFKPDGVSLFYPLTKLFNLPRYQRDVEYSMEKLRQEQPTEYSLIKSVFLMNREILLPNLLIRGGQIQDHDDLIPIFDSQSDVVTSTYGDYFLVDVINNQDDNNKVLVGLNPDKEPVGLMALSGDIDVEILQDCFQLESYLNLTRVVDVYVKIKIENSTNTST